ncbi:MAG: hypothetical protein ACKOQ3_07325 [Novosphingobium sp.]
MTPLSAATVQTALPDAAALPGAAPQSAGEAAQLADFGAILAALPGAPTGPQLAEPRVPVPIAEAPGPTLLDPAEPASALPPGNGLPPALPPTLPPQPGKPVLRVPIQRTLPSAKPVVADPEIEPAETDHAIAAAPSEPLPVEPAATALLTLAPPPISTSPAHDAGAARPEAALPPGRSGIAPMPVPLRTLPTAPDAPSHPAQARPLVVQVAGEAAPLPAAPQPAPASAPPPLRLAEAAASAAAPARPSHPVSVAALAFEAARDSEAPPAPQFTFPLGTASIAPTGSPVTAPAAPAAPHDFAALVDRLTAAREALQPQAVTIAISHGDFGPVRLHFRHEDGALSVTMASGDPDFARAVAAAPPVQPAAPAGDSPQTQQRGSDTRPGDSGTGQSRSHAQGERRDGRAARANPQPAGQTRHDTAAQSGIFA